ncbi:NARE ribosyltransferase, partial [Turnix velox]|nr:NARE ribosyltransferase [Turnix velox]
MEHLLLALVLLPITPTTLQPIKEVMLDMALTSFDDQYLGCSHLMEEELVALNRTELTTNKVYADNWFQATTEWRRRWKKTSSPSTRLNPQQEVAILAYTMQQSLYQVFNVAVREAGRSREDYLTSFNFKVLHFLLTQALVALKASQSHQKCHQVYRGIKGIHFTTIPQGIVRFGHFTSTSLKKEKALSFGQDTIFVVNTCYGVPIQDFSYYPDEEEVLIPPYETFQVTNVTQHGGTVIIQLRSQSTFSSYNCEWVAG